jgi:hypothetical protein
MILVGHSKVEMQRRMDFIRADFYARFNPIATAPFCSRCGASFQNSNWG